MTTYLLTFDSTHEAMAAFRRLDEAKISYVTIPTPTAIGKGCGMAALVTLREGLSMTVLLDCFGKACPLPLMMAKKELDQGCRDVSVKVDNEIAVANLSHLGKRERLEQAVKPIDGGWMVRLFENRASTASASSLQAGDEASNASVVFISSDQIGTGDPELGAILMKMALYTLSESETAPSSLLFMNSGVKLATTESLETAEHVRTLQVRGTEVLVCGTCLNFYGLTDQLQVGEISNMYDILERMQHAPKVISL